MSIASIELEQDRMGISAPSQVMLMFTRLAASMRKRRESRRRLQTLRSLPNRVLLDIGVDPMSVRDEPFPMPEQFPLFPTREGGR